MPSPPPNPNKNSAHLVEPRAVNSLYTPKRPRPIHRQMDFGLSDEELHHVSEMILNWGAVDFYIEAALYNLHAHVSLDSKKPIRTIDTKRQIELLSKLERDKRLPAAASEYLQELRFCCSNYKSPRNIIAHGMLVAVHGVTNFMQPTGKCIKTDDLHLYVQQSRYAIFVAKWLLQVIVGHQQPMPLLDRPPVEP